MGGEPGSNVRGIHSRDLTDVELVRARLEVLDRLLTNIWKKHEGIASACAMIANEGVAATPAEQNVDTPRMGGQRVVAGRAHDDRDGFRGLRSEFVRDRDIVGLV